MNKRKMIKRARRAAAEGAFIGTAEALKRFGPGLRCLCGGRAMVAAALRGLKHGKSVEAGTPNGLRIRGAQNEAVDNAAVARMIGDMYESGTTSGSADVAPFRWDVAMRLNRIRENLLSGRETTTDDEEFVRKIYADRHKE